MTTFDPNILASSSSFNNLVTNDNPLGIIHPYSGLVAPNSSWKLCDGSAISKTTYAGLWTLLRSLTIGTAGTGAVAIASGANAVVTIAGHGLSSGDCVYFSSLVTVTTIVIDTNYWVTVVNADTFKLSSSWALYLAGTFMTNGAGAGTGVIVYAPYGISTSANFLIPDLRGVSIGGAGVGVLGTSVETFRIGVFYDDKMQGFNIGSSATKRIQLRSSNQYAALGGGEAGTNVIDEQTVASSNYGPNANATNGTPRTGSVTRGKVVGTNYIIKVL